MTPSKIWIFPAAAAALTIGHVGYDPKLTGEGFPFPPTYTVLAAEQPAEPSSIRRECGPVCKIGKKSGTQAVDEADTPESDTKKVDQPPRQNPTTGN